MTNVKSIKILVVFLFLAYSAINVKADNEQLASREDLKQLEADLTAALGDKFEFVKGEVAEDESSTRYWLATIRARQAGEFVLHCTVKYRLPAKIKINGPKGAEFTYHLAIGESGASRVYDVGQYGIWVSPHACVSDLLVIPIRLGFADTEHRFEMPRQLLNRDEVVFKGLRETFDRGHAVVASKSNVDVRNQAKDLLELVHGEVWSSPTRSLDRAHHHFSATFDIVNAGKFNLNAVLKWKDGAINQNKEESPFTVVAKGEALSILVTRFGGIEGGAELRKHVHELRVGDRLVLQCGGYSTSGLKLLKEHPSVELDKRPFQPAGETFKAWTENWHGEGKNGAVAIGGQEALDASLAMLKSGGNAADAAAVGILMMTVTDHTLVCLGGEVPIMFYDAKTKGTEVYCGQGAAPGLATREYFAKKGGIPGKGIEPAAVPATLDALMTLLERRGTKTFAEVTDSTLKMLIVSKEPWHAAYAATLRRLIDAEKESPKDRKRGLRLVADYFYRGPLANEIDFWMKYNGGLIRYRDLATHFTRIEEPESVDYRGHTVLKCGFWTQGPYLLQTLKLLEGFDLKGMGHNRPDTVHVMVEAMKLALADRDEWYADPMFAKVPSQELLSTKYAELRRPLIEMKKSSSVRQVGDPWNMKSLLSDPKAPQGPGSPSRDTSTCVVVDKEGNVVAATPSGFNGVMMPSTGIWFNSRLQSFNIQAGSPNCIEPGKRPRITLTPGLVLKDGKVILALSSAGGDQQDQALLQLLVSCLDFGMSPKEAVTAPRFGTMHHIGSFGQTAPKLGNVLLYPNIGSGVREALEKRGANVTLQEEAWGRPVVVRIDPASGLIEAAGDPRAKRNAGAY